MRTLYETIRTWRDAQRSLDQRGPTGQAAHQVIVDRLLVRLQRHRSLADLANGYYRDGEWWRPVVAEFSVAPDTLDGEAIHDAAYYQRLLQLRRPRGK